MKHTHTVAELAVSPDVWNEIADKLTLAGYDHAFLDNGKLIDMTGIGLVMEEEESPGAFPSDGKPKPGPKARKR